MRNPFATVTPQDPPVVRDLLRFNNIRESIMREPGKAVYSWLSEHLDIEHERTMVIMTKTAFNVHALSDNFFKNLINLARINDIPRINKFFHAINEKLPTGGLFSGCVETKGERKKRILSKYPIGVNYTYYSFDFIFKRVFPKLPLTKKIYFRMTAGRNRVLSKTETYGRLYSCGFTIVAERKINGKLYFIAKKVREPYSGHAPSYGPICKMRRLGKNGKLINVYKFRTMHPYAEYLQEYVYEKNNLQEGGKFKNDFRVTTLGKFMRKYWIDELPMLANLLRGDLKLFGVRPLSSHYLSLYSDELKETRAKVKPGLIPPFYADLPKTLDEIQESERKYLESYLKNPMLTDFRYFSKAIKNILIKKGVRSN